MTVRHLLIVANNWLVRHRRRRFAPTEILVLLPRCLQHVGCGRNVIADLDACRRCGQCNVPALLALRDATGVRFQMAGGGRAAASLTHQPTVRAIVACACEKELCDGIRVAFPKPVLAVTNDIPEGFCRNTRVDVARLRAAIQVLIQTGCGRPSP